jgi:hypothetical protein
VPALTGLAVVWVLTLMSSACSRGVSGSEEARVACRRCGRCVRFVGEGEREENSGDHRGCCWSHSSSSHVWRVLPHKVCANGIACLLMSSLTVAALASGSLHVRISPLRSPIQAHEDTPAGQ